MSKTLPLSEVKAKLSEVVDEIVSLDDYRRRHALYKTDPDLQAAHASAPWIMIWDDHETANDSYTDGAENHQPDVEGDWSARKRAALQAYFEWTPVREPQPGRAREALWRTFEVGDLATLVMLETRMTGRSRQLTWDDAPVPYTANPNDAEARAATDAFLRDVVGAEDRHMLGSEQEADVEAALTRSVAAGKPWQILGNEVILAPIVAPDFVEAAPRWLKLYLRLRNREAYAYLRRSEFNVPLNLDQWDGYPAARRRLYAAAERSGAQLLALAGDTHNFFVNELYTDDGARMGVELGTSGVSSPSAFLGIPRTSVDIPALMQATNPHILHHNAYDRGYIAVTLTPKSAHAELRRVTDVEDPGGTVEPYKAYRIAKNEAGTLQASETAPRAPTVRRQA